MSLLTHVTFRHPAEFIGDQEDGSGVLDVRGAGWFADILRRVPELELDPDVIQEDWGVVFRARRREKKFWVGLSGWDSDGGWVAHFHHDSFAWLQRLIPGGARELEHLLVEVRDVLAKDPAITEAAWHVSVH